MRILYNESLAKYTTFRIGGIAKQMFFPENEEDLASIPNLISSRIIGAGSNLLINDKQLFDSVVCTNNLNKHVLCLDNGNIFIGTGVRIQNAIASINKAGYGGLEYLISIPASIGGAIYMNAGVYSPQLTTISDYIVNVTVFVNGNVEIWSKDKCSFSQRCSIFHKEKAIILGAEFNFPKQKIDISKKKIAERMSLAKRQDHSGGNCGSVFKICNSKLARILKILHPSWGGAAWSAKTSNWIVNKGKASYKDIKMLINISILLHKIFFQKCEQEVIEWE